MIEDSIDDPCQWTWLEISQPALDLKMLLIMVTRESMAGGGGNGAGRDKANLKHLQFNEFVLD